MKSSRKKQEQEKVFLPGIENQVPESVREQVAQLLECGALGAEAAQIVAIIAREDVLFASLNKQEIINNYSLSINTIKLLQELYKKQGDANQKRDQRQTLDQLNVILLELYQINTSVAAEALLIKPLQAHVMLLTQLIFQLREHNSKLRRSIR